MHGHDPSFALDLASVTSVSLTLTLCKLPNSGVCVSPKDKRAVLTLRKLKAAVYVSIEGKQGSGATCSEVAFNLGLEMSNSRMRFSPPGSRKRLALCQAASGVGSTCACDR